MWQKSLHWLVDYLLVLIAKHGSKGLIDLSYASKGALIVADLDYHFVLIAEFSDVSLRVPSKVLFLDHFAELFKIFLSLFVLIENALEEVTIQFVDRGHLEVDLAQFGPILTDTSKSKIDVITNLIKIVKFGLL